MNLSDLTARAGLTFLGTYRSSSPNWPRARRNLGKPVTKVAVDRGIERRLPKSQTAGLVAGRDNRSVTSPQWVAEGLARYGCPIHPTKANGIQSDEADGTQFTVPGLGPCACRKQDGTTRGAKRDVGRVSARTSSSRPVPVQGPLPDVLGRADEGADVASRRAGESSDTTLGHNGGRPAGRWHARDYGDAFRATLSVAGNKDGGRKPYPLSEVVEKFVHRSHYAGAPYFDRNFRVLDVATEHARRIWKGSRTFDPYMFGRRVQPGRSSPKTRLVWMASLATSIVGAAFSKRVHQGLERKRPFAIGLRSVEKGALVSELQSRFRYVYSLDYSAFDSSAPAFMVDDVFRVLREHLDLDDEARNVWDRYVSDFIHSRIITPDGTVFQKHKGIPSGSMFTSLVGSVLNLLLMNYVWIRATGEAAKPDRLLIQGDDVIFASNTRVDLGDLARYAAELGFIVSVEKSQVIDSRREAPDPFTNTVHFLGHYWYRGWAHRPKMEIIQRMVYTERHRKRTDKESLMRFYSYLTDAWESWEIHTMVFPAEDAITSITRCLDELGDHEIVVDADDLPGQLRFFARVVQEAGDDPLPVRGMALGILPLIF